MRPGELLGAGEVSRVAYPPELLLGALVQDVAANTTGTWLNITNLRSTGSLVVLKNTVSRQVASTYKLIAADTLDQDPMLTDAEPDGLPTEGSWPAWRNLRYQIQNQQSATDDPNYQADFGLWVLAGTIAEKIAIVGRGDYTKVQWSAAEQQTIDTIGEKHLLELVQSNLRPWDPAQIMAREAQTYHRRVIATEVDVAAGNGTSNRTTVLELTPAPGRVLALRSIQIDTSLGGTLTLADQVADDVEVHISRDDNPDLDVWPGYAANQGLTGGSLSRVFSHWIKALAKLTVELTAKSAVNAIPIRCVVDDLPFSDIMKVRWNTPEGQKIADDNPKFAAQVRGGLL